MNPAFVPTNSRRVFFFSGRDRMTRVQPEFVDAELADPRLREAPEDYDEDDEENDKVPDDEEDDGNSDGYSE